MYTIQSHCDAILNQVSHVNYGDPHGFSHTNHCSMQPSLVATHGSQDYSHVYVMIIVAHTKSNVW